MKMLLVAATALTMTGSALAYQTPEIGVDVDASATATAPGVDIALDPTVAMTPRASWTPDQLALYEQHIAFYPSTWTAEQQAAFQAMRSLPPANWSTDQRTLYEQHMASLPADWTAEQRAMYEQQIASFRTPWLSAQQTASVDPAGVPATTTVQPDFSTFAGMGGAYEQVYGSGTVSLSPRPADQNYPPCEPGPGDDNCIQLYERGVRDELSSWRGPMGGLADGSMTTAVGGPYQAAGPADAGKPAAPSPSPTAATSGTMPSTGMDHSTHVDTATSPVDKPPADPTGTTEDDTTEPSE